MELTDRFKATLIDILGIFLFASVPWLIPTYELNLPSNLPYLFSLIFPVAAFYYTRKKYPEMFWQGVIFSLVASIFILPVVFLNIFLAG